MVTDRIATVLEQLKAERVLVGERLRSLQGEVDETAALLQSLDVAIASLDTGSPATPARERNLGKPPEAGEFDVPRLRHDVPRESAKRLIDFIVTNADEDRETLQPSKMLAAVVDDLAEPVSRERLKDAFFDYFDRDLLKRYWQDPDKAFRGALRRAVEREMIQSVEYPNGQVVYMGGFRDPRGRPTMRRIKVKRATDA